MVLVGRQRMKGSQLLEKDVASVKLYEKKKKEEDELIEARM